MDVSCTRPLTWTSRRDLHRRKVQAVAHHRGVTLNFCGATLWAKLLPIKFNRYNRSTREAQRKRVARELQSNQRKKHCSKNQDKRVPFISICLSDGDGTFWEWLDTWPRRFPILDEITSRGYPKVGCDEHKFQLPKNITKFY
uniref:Uncharacterized protein n=1 Tax=Sipha flava TaxID=143950 RepID=A0A2S2Q3C5_9HEMI